MWRDTCHFIRTPRKHGYILYQGAGCQPHGWGDVATRCVCCTAQHLPYLSRLYRRYTEDAFATLGGLLSETSGCQLARSTQEFKHDAHKGLIYCVAFDTESSTNSHSLSLSGLYSSTDLFDQDNKVEDLGTWKNAYIIMVSAIPPKFAPVALEVLTNASPRDRGHVNLLPTYIIGAVLCPLTTTSHASLRRRGCRSLHCGHSAVPKLSKSTPALAADATIPPLITDLDDHNIPPSSAP